MSSTSYSHYAWAGTIKLKLTRAASKSSFLSVMMLTISMLLPGQARAATRWVDALAASLPPGSGCGINAGYTTIQAAVNASAPGDIISVCEGFYLENVSISIANLTLNGAQAGNAVAGRVSGGPLESTVQGANPIGANSVFRINAPNVVIDGFTVKNPVTTSAAIGIGVKVTGNGAVIKNNIVDGVTTTDLTVNGTAQAIYLEAGPDNVQILGNDLRNVHSNRSAKGVTIGDSSSTNPSQNIRVEGNSIENIISDTRGAYGVSINNGNGNTANSGLVIRNNTISTLAGGGWVPSASGLQHTRTGPAI